MDAWLINPGIVSVSCKLLSSCGIESPTFVQVVGCRGMSLVCLWWLLLARCAVLVGCRADSLLLHRVSSKADRLVRMDSLLCLKGPTYLLALRLCFSLPRPYFLF